MKLILIFCCASVWAAKTVIVGGGLAGLHAAYFSAKAGNEVVVINKEGDNASQTNAGNISPAFYGLVDFTLPEIFRQATRNGSVIKVNFLGSIFPLKNLWWNIRFVWEKIFPSVKSADKQKIFHALQTRNREIWEQMAKEGITIQKTGRLFLPDKKGNRDTDIKRLLTIASNFEGENPITEIDTTRISASECQSLEPTMRDPGGDVLLYKGDRTVHAPTYISELQELLKKKGVQFISDTVTDLQETQKGTVSAAQTTSGQTIEGDQFILATGATNFGPSHDSFPGAGMSIDLKLPQPVKYTAFNRADATYFVPTKDGIRLTSGYVHGGWQVSPSSEQPFIDHLISSFKRTYNYDGDIEIVAKHTGARPLSATGLPAAGVVPGKKNLGRIDKIDAYGYNSLALSEYLVSIMNGKKPEQALAEMGMDESIKPSQIGL